MSFFILIFLIVVIALIIILVVRRRRRSNKVSVMQDSDILDDHIRPAPDTDYNTSDIFISYAREDRESAQLLADALEAMGHSVFWDREIIPGQAFDEVIEKQLDATRCVIVLWTQHSIDSRWVRSEASEALDRKALIPVLLEDVKIPLEFRNIQAAEMKDLSSSNAASGAHQLKPAIDRMLGNALG